MASLALALHAATARPRHGSCQTLITLTRQPLRVSAPFMCPAPAFCVCLAPPAVDLLEALDRCVCTRRACCFCLRIYRTSAAPLSFFLGVGSPSLFLAGFMLKAVRRGSLSFSCFVVASAACVHETRDHGLTLNQALQVLNHWEWLNTCYR